MNCLRSRYTQENTELVDINHLRAEKVKLHFTKMVGCGNDYIYFNCLEESINNPEGLSVRLADRHFGIGGDGAVLICPSDKADARMRMFNLDGSEGMMCGNAIRCVCKYLYDNGIVPKKVMEIETASGIKRVELLKRNGEVKDARVEMGKADFSPAAVPVRLEGERVIDRPVTIEGKEYRVTCVSMGNPHCVIFHRNVDLMRLDGIGPEIEHGDIFPDRANVEFVQVLSRRMLRMRVWERGSGETFACGTGACAAVAAAVENGFCDKDKEITVLLPGGELSIRYTEDMVYLTGNAEKVYEGIVEF